MRQKEQAEPQEDEEEEEEGGNMRCRRKMERNKMQQAEKQAMPQADPMDAIELPNPGLLCNLIRRTNLASPYVKRVPFPERIHWHALRGPKPIWIPWPRGIAAIRDEHIERVKCARLFMKYGTRRGKRGKIYAGAIPYFADRFYRDSTMSLFGPPLPYGMLLYRQAHSCI